MRGLDASQRNLILDVANEGLSPYSVSALEKDFHLSAVLGCLYSKFPELPSLVLCGGTSLAKGHGLISRMSEDMDFKVVVDSDLSKNQRKLFLSRMKKEIASILADEGFLLAGVSANDQHNFFKIELEYSPSFPIEAALRPHILLEFTAQTPILPAVVCRSNSLLGIAASKELHSVSMTCLDVHETIAEKSVAFLRRSRKTSFQAEGSRDRRLVRHVYDIGTIALTGFSLSAIQVAFANAIDCDAKKYVSQDPEFANNPRFELSLALVDLDLSLLQADYEGFVESLVAGTAVSFDQAFENFRTLLAELLREL